MISPQSTPYGKSRDLVAHPWLRETSAPMRYLEPFRRFVRLEIRYAVRTILLEITILLMLAIQVCQVKQTSLSRNANSYSIRGFVA